MAEFLGVLLFIVAGFAFVGPDGRLDVPKSNGVFRLDFFCHRNVSLCSWISHGLRPPRACGRVQVESEPRERTLTRWAASLWQEAEND